MKKILLLSLILIFAVSSSVFAKDFSDLAKEHWAYDYINKLSNEGIIDGFEDGSFKPSETLTKAQFIKLMVSSDELLLQELNLLSPNYYADKPWYESYFDIVKEYNLLPYGYEKDILNTSISRKDMAEILSNFIKFVSAYNSCPVILRDDIKDDIKNNPDFLNNSFKNYLTEIDATLMTSFPDVLNLDKNAQENILIVKDFGIINGYEDNTFRPYNFVTRAEASKVISVYNSFIEFNLVPITPNTDIPVSEPDNNTITNSSIIDNDFEGIYTNAANETLKYIDWVSFHEGRDNNSFSVFESAKENVYDYIPNSFEKTNNRFIINFNELYLMQTSTPDCQFALICDGTTFNSYVIDMYNISDDKTYLKSELRGPKYDFYRVNNQYGVSEYIKDSFDFDNSINGVYNTGEKSLEIIAMKCQNLGANDAIRVLSSGSYTTIYYYWKENLIDNSRPYVLDLYLKGKDISSIKVIYTNRYYANYCSGIIVYKDGTMEQFSIQMSKTDVGKVQIDSESKLIRTDKINMPSNDMEFLDKWNYQTYINDNTFSN